MKSVYIEDSIHSQLRLLSALEECSLSSLVEAFLKKGIKNKLNDLPTSALRALAAQGGSFDFLEASAEDIYSDRDGVLVH